MSIPVFHDDQHGTAIISAAAILNALQVTGRNIAEVTVVCSGAGAAAISCLNLWCDPVSYTHLDVYKRQAWMLPIEKAGQGQRFAKIDMDLAKHPLDAAHTAHEAEQRFTLLGLALSLIHI